MANSIQDIVKSIGDKFGVPFQYLYPIYMTESGGDTTAHALTSSEDSRGLFQINIKAHPDANSGQLFDPSYNANYIMPTLANTYKEAVAKGLTGVNIPLYMEQYGERPQWTTSVVNSITSNYNNFMSGNVQATTLNNTNTSPVTATPTSVTSVAGDLFSNLKYYAMNLVLFIFLLLALYMIFIYKEA